MENQEIQGLAECQSYAFSSLVSWLGINGNRWGRDWVGPRELRRLVTVYSW